MFIGKLIKEKFYIFSIVGYMLTTVISGTILRDGLVLFLTINMFLAGVAYAISVLASYLNDKKNKVSILIILSVLWLLFFPNTIYITTDFIHLQNYDFFISYNSIYAYTISDWYVLFLIFVGALIGAKIGIKSLNMMLDIWQIKKNLYKILSILGIFVLSSIGIYVGRFLRLNSWDFYRLDIMLNGIVEQFYFFIGFIVILTMIHIVYYLIFNKKGDS